MLTKAVMSITGSGQVDQITWYKLNTHCLNVYNRNVKMILKDSKKLSKVQYDSGLVGDLGEISPYFHLLCHS